MKYDPYKDVYNLYTSGQAWQNESDEKKRKKIADDAQTNYNNLRAAGMTELADEIESSGTERRKELANKYGMSGRSRVRDAFYGFGRSYGMTNEDVDNILKYNDATGEIYLGGRNIGTPDAVVDGVSYVKNIGKWKDEFDSYAKGAGLTKTPEAIGEENRVATQNKIEQLWGTETSDHNKRTDLWENEYNDLKSTNPFSTPEANSIMQNYRWQGDNAARGAVADSAASNSGNVDSFAAANAARQQLAFTNAGNQAVLAAYNAKLEHARALLEGMGVQHSRDYEGMRNTIRLGQEEDQRQFDNNETKRLNDIDINERIANVTGYSPIEYTRNNEYLNPDGTVKAKYLTKEFDDMGGFQALIDNTKDPEVIRQLKEAQTKKAYGNPTKYKEWLPNIDAKAEVKERTADYDLTKQQIDSGERIALSGDDVTKYTADVQERIALSGDDVTKYTADVQAKNNIDQMVLASQLGGNQMDIETAEKALKNGDITQAAIDAYNTAYRTSYTVDNPPGIANVAEKVGLDAEEDNKIKNILSEAKKGNYTTTDNGVDYYGAKLINGYVEENSEALSKENFIAYAVENSKRYNVDLKQFKKVCKFLKFTPTEVAKLDKMLQNASDNWRDGMTYKEKSSSDDWLE